MARWLFFVMATIGWGTLPQLATAQCDNCDANYPLGNYYSTTSNTLVTSVGCHWGGEYAFYNVTAGETYTWTTCGNTAWDTQLTLYNGISCGSGFLAYNDDFCGLQSTITWTAPFTGTVNLLISQWNCASNSGGCMEVQWACTTCGGGGGGNTTCNGNFYDTGGPGGNYSNFEDYSVTYCPASAGECTSADFISFNVENSFDFLYVFDGNTTAAPLLGVYTGAISPGTITATTQNPSGCLTFLFQSDFLFTEPGWVANITCDTCVDPPPASQQECIGGTTVCSDQTFTGNSSGSGTINDLNSINDGCLSGENQTSWYLFSPATSGNIGFTLSPNIGVDYDFAIWGPYPEGSSAGDICPPSGTPIRCSYASGFSTNSATGSYNTGIGSSTYSPPQFDSPYNTHEEDPGGDGWVPGLSVTAGEVYVLVIDNFSANTTPFDLNWNLQGGATLDCTVLPVEMLNFSGKRVNRENLLEWQTASETNADYFAIERSDNAQSFQTIGQVPATGNSNTISSYSYTDAYWRENVYYRLKQVDFDGAFEYYGPVAIHDSQSGIVIDDPFPNPTNGNWINLNVFTPHSIELNVDIQDMTGRIIKTETHQFDRGSQLLRIDLSECITGAYQLKLTDGEQNILHSSRIIR